MYAVRLTKTSANQNKLRTDVVLGITIEMPQVGEVFEVLCKPMADGFDFRFVATSVVKEIDWVAPERICNIVTLHSTYRLEVLKRIERDGMDIDALKSYSSFEILPSRILAAVVDALPELD